MGVANGTGDDAGTRAPRKSALVYTQSPVASSPAVISPEEPATEDSENAAV